MNDQISKRIYDAFNHIYPDQSDHTDGIFVNSDDNHLLVEIEGCPMWVCHDNPETSTHLSFSPYDPDYSEEFPNEDPNDFLMIRVRISEAD